MHVVRGWLFISILSLALIGCSSGSSDNSNGNGATGGTNGATTGDSVYADGGETVVGGTDEETVAGDTDGETVAGGTDEEAVAGDTAGETVAGGTDPGDVEDQRIGLSDTISASITKDERVRYSIQDGERVEVLSTQGDTDFAILDEFGNTLCQSGLSTKLDSCSLSNVSLPTTLEIIGFTDASYKIRLLPFDVEECDRLEQPHIGQPGQRVYQDDYLSSLNSNFFKEKLLPDCSDPFQNSDYYAGLDLMQEVDGEFPNYTESQWRQSRGLIDGAGNTSASISAAQYINSHDLGFGRDMECLDDGDRYPCIVVNYNVGDDPKLPGNPTFIASVAMERVARSRVPNCASTVEGCDGWFTAFYVFGGAKGRRLAAIDLDRTGNKSVPEACHSCHYGGVAPQTGTYDPYLAGQYLPFDVTLFTQFPGSSSVNDQLADGFAPLNRVILDVAQNRESRVYNDAGDHEDIVAEIDQWLNFRYWTDARRYHPLRAGRRPGWEDYCITDDGPGEQQVCDGTDDFFTHAERNYFRGKFYAAYCRTCHVAQAGRPFGEKNALEGCALCHSSPTGGDADVLERVLCPTTGETRMPNARITHLRLFEDAQILDEIGLDVSCQLSSPPLTPSLNVQPGD